LCLRYFIYNYKLLEEYELKFKQFKDKLMDENEQLLKKEKESLSLREKGSFNKFEKYKVKH
jgi:hypothetical protein